MNTPPKAGSPQAARSPVRSQLKRARAEANALTLPELKQLLTEMASNVGSVLALRTLSDEPAEGSGLSGNSRESLIVFASHCGQDGKFEMFFYLVV